MFQVILGLVIFFAGLAAGVFFAPKFYAEEAKASSELHALYNAGLVEEHKLTEYIDALIATAKAHADSFLP